MFLLLVISLMVINMCVTYYPLIFYSRLAGENGRYLFIVPAIFGLPVYLARILSPFYLDFPTEDFKYFAVALTSDNLHGMAQVLTILLISRFLSRVKVSRLYNNPIFSIDLTNKRKRQLLILIGIFLMILALGALISLASVSGFGIGNWISYPRIGYQEYRRGNGHYWVFAQVLLSISAILLLVTSQTKFKFIAYALANGAIWWFLGSKAFIIGFGSFATAMWFYKFGKNFFILGLMIIMIFLIMIANWLLNTEMQLSLGDFSGIMEYFDMYQVGIMYYKEYYANQISLYYGDVYLSSFWSYVPRALYEDKPWVYGIYLVVDHFFPGGPESGNTPGFAGSVEQFADFGYAGLLVAPLLDLTFLMRTAAIIFICRALRDGTWRTGRMFLLSIFFMAPNWTPWAGGLYLVGLIFVVILVFLCLNLWGRKSRVHEISAYQLTSGK